MNNQTLRYFISASKVRQTCIDQNWYTCGDNDAYGHMLSVLCKETSLSAVQDVATDIVAHSDWDQMMDMANQCNKQAYKCVMDYILNDCVWISVQ